MIAVWSFWSKPFFVSRKGIWVHEKHHLLSWVLSVETARKHFQKTVLYTDDLGARMLIDGLDLEFDEVSTALNALAGHDPRWWALGKIFTYKLQQEPFIHIDSDVYLWKPLPLTSQTLLFAQNPEPFVIGASYYKPEQFEAAVKRQPSGWLPQEWRWYRSCRHGQRAESCGVFGGNQTDFIHHYATLGVRLIEHPGNQNAWKTLSNQAERNILVEQYLLSACIEYHQNNPDSPHYAINIHYLFATMDDAFNPEKAKQSGYTHLIADTKKNKTIARNLERRVEKDYPAAYARCLKHIRSSTILSPELNSN